MSNRETTDQRPSAGAAFGSLDVPAAAVLPVWQSQPRPWWSWGPSAACVFAVWIATLVLGLVAALRLCYHDGIYLLVWLNAFTLYIYLPAYAVLAWATWRRRWILAAASGMIVLCHLAWVGPDFIPVTRSSQSLAGSAAHSPTMRIFFANVRATNTDFQSMLDEIAEADPDVVVLVEYSWPWYQALRNSPILAPYVYRHQRADVGRIACFSRLPVVNAEEPRVANRYCRNLTIRLGSDLVRLFCLHGPRPVESPWYDYTGYWQQMLPLLARQPEPLVVVGDFNATQHSNVYEQLTSGVLRSAHEDRGRGYATTWPNGQLWLPPIRIDQALLSPDVECLGITEGRGEGSDHRPLILDVRIRHDRPAASTRAAADSRPTAGN